MISILRKDEMQHKNAEYFDVLGKFIEDYWDRYGVSPTTRVIAAGTNLSNSTVSRYLQYMKDHGMIDYQGHRCYKTRKQLLGETGLVQLPLLGRVACGISKFAEENIEGYKARMAIIMKYYKYLCTEQMAARDR